MTGPDHYRAAEGLLARQREIVSRNDGSNPEAALLIAEAQVHATLALAAATALPHVGQLPVPDCEAWEEAAGEEAATARRLTAANVEQRDLLPTEEQYDRAALAETNERNYRARVDEPEQVECTQCRTPVAPLMVGAGGRCASCCGTTPALGITGPGSEVEITVAAGPIARAIQKHMMPDPGLAVPTPLPSGCDCGRKPGGMHVQRCAVLAAEREAFLA